MEHIGEVILGIAVATMIAAAICIAIENKKNSKK